MRLSGLLAVGMAANVIAIPALTTKTVTVIVTQTSTPPVDMTTTSPDDMSTTIANITETMTATTTATMTRSKPTPHWSLPSGMTWDTTEDAVPSALHIGTSSFSYGYHTSVWPSSVSSESFSSYGYHTSVWSSVTQSSSGYGYHSPSTTSSYGYNVPLSSSTLTSTTEMPSSATSQMTESLTTSSEMPITTTSSGMQSVTSSDTETATPSSVHGTCEELHPEDPKYCHSVVEAHNRHRRNHTVPEVHWDPEIYKTALIIAKRCNFTHQDANIGKGGSWVGQNLAVGSDYLNIEGAITNGFYNSEFSFFLDEYYGQPSPPETNFHRWGHFTELLWKEVVGVACATISCPKLGCTPDLSVSPPQCPSGVLPKKFPKWLTVCHYSPGGNVMGTFDKNVLRPRGDLPYTAPNVFTTLSSTVTIFPSSTVTEVTSSTVTGTSSSINKSSPMAQATFAPCEEAHPEDPKYCQDTLDAYNRLRRNHTVPEMYWNRTLYEKALRIANTCNISHQDPNFGQGGPGMSQNLVNGFMPANIGWGLIDLYNGEYGESKVDDYGKIDPFNMFTVPMTHLTAMIWKDSITVGCATALCYNLSCTPHLEEDGHTSCPDGLMNPNRLDWYTVCHHYPAGSIDDKTATDEIMKNNLLPPRGDPMYVHPRLPEWTMTPSPDATRGPQSWTTPSPTSTPTPPPNALAKKAEITDGSCEQLYPQNPKYCQDVLDAHNRHRRNHTVPDMHWDPVVYESARYIAESCELFTDRQDLNGAQYGHYKTVAGNPPQIQRMITNFWYNEGISSFLDEYYGMPTPPQPGTPPGYSQGYAFTQIIWKDSTGVGCHTQRCSAGVSCKMDPSTEKCPTGVLDPRHFGHWLTICAYSVRGNEIGFFGGNITRPRGDPTVWIDFGDGTDY